MKEVIISKLRAAIDNGFYSKDGEFVDLTSKEKEVLESLSKQEIEDYYTSYDEQTEFEIRPESLKDFIDYIVMQEKEMA